MIQIIKDIKKSQEYYVILSHTYKFNYQNKLLCIIYKAQVNGVEYVC